MTESDVSKSQTTIAPGDVVAQPDGPPMTVEQVDADIIHCVWFVGTMLMRDSFRRQRLQGVQNV